LARLAKRFLAARNAGNPVSRPRFRPWPGRRQPAFQEVRQCRALGECMSEPSRRARLSSRLPRDCPTAVQGRLQRHFRRGPWPPTCQFRRENRAHPPGWGWPGLVEIFWALSTWRLRGCLECRVRVLSSMLTRS